MWRRTISQIPTHFGRLVYLARLRDSVAGGYVYPPLTEILGSEITNRTLAASHHQLFAEWIGFPLARQKADLEEYLSGNRPVELQMFRDVMPEAAHEVERQLYLTDLETLLSLLRCAPGSASSVPET